MFGGLPSEAMSENVQRPGRSLRVPLIICLSRRIAPHVTVLERREAAQPDYGVTRFGGVNRPSGGQLMNLRLNPRNNSGRTPLAASIHTIGCCDAPVAQVGTGPLCNTSRSAAVFEAS